MKKNIGFSVVSIAACVFVWGCFQVDKDEDQAAKKQQIVASGSFAAQSLLSNSQDQMLDPDAVAASLKQAGFCQKFIDFIVDGMNVQDCEDKACYDKFVSDATDFLRCLGVDATIDSDSLSVKIGDLVSNPKELQSCICGGSGSLGDFSLLATTQFSAGSSSASGESYSAGSSSTSGESYSAGSSSSSGQSYSAGSSTTAGGTFQAK